MKLKYTLIMASLGVSFNLFAADSFYCPQHQGYIKLGMSPDQVIAACGQPLTQENSNQPVMQQIPVQQLIYNNMGSSTAFYGPWQLPTGNQGAHLQIDVMNNVVKAVRLNGASNNAFSICGGTNIQVGDPVTKVYNACGNPSISNNTFTNVPIQSKQKPVVWTYKPGEYQPSITLTFVNGQLQSISN